MNDMLLVIGFPLLFIIHFYYGKQMRIGKT